MNAIRAHLTRLWENRRDRRWTVRATWALGVLGLLLLMFGTTFEKGLLLAAWIVYNLILCLLAVSWGLFHPTALRPASNQALRWSAWLTLLSALAIYTTMESNVSRTQSMTASVLLLISLALAPLLYLSFLALSLMAGVIGAFVFWKRGEGAEAAAVAVTAWWVAILALAFLVVLADSLHLSETLQWALMFAVPQATVWITSGMRKRRYGGQNRLRRLTDSLLGRLTFRYRRRGRVRTADLRGMAIGLFVAVVTLLIGGQVLETAQEFALVSLMRIRAQVIGAISEATSLQGTPPGVVALINMDGPTQAVALTSSSEAAQQAAILRRLSGLGVTRIILPLPTLAVTRENACVTTQDAVNRTLRDIPDLAKAMREAGNVMLVTPPNSDSNPAVALLKSAAREVARFGVEPFGAAQTPAIPIQATRPGSDPPAPLLALAAMRSRALQVTPIAGDPDDISVSGAVVPLGAPGEAFVDFRSGAAIQGRREGAPTFNHTDVIKYPKLTMITKDGEEKQVSTAAYLAHKIVVLEPLIQTTVETPVGAMPRYEVLARATNSLLLDRMIRRLPPIAPILWTLTLGMLVGLLCVGREPLKASWRAALLLFIQFAYIFLVYFFGGVWADPVVPLATAIVTFLLVTQLTFALERDERERNRALFSRFLAKEFVDELLDSSAHKLALGGEKRDVCVLFADVRDFTGFAESHQPEEVIEIMNLYLTSMTDALDRFGGILDKYTGDGLMAFFEIKKDTRLELRSAVTASLAMRDAALETSKQLAIEGRRTLDIGIGMHFGEAIVGLVGNEERQINYTALGHTVVVSARLQTLAAGGEVVISQTIFDMIEEVFCVIADEPVHVKGITAMMRPYRVICPVPESPPV